LPAERQDIRYDDYDHVMSASQLSTFQLCERKWAFQSIFRMPRQESESNVFGTTLHSIAERWLKADDLGRDDTGAPLQMYPSEWDKDISPANASAIRSLIDKAITSGVLVRRKYRQIEHPIFDDVIPGVKMQGYIDMLLPGEIQDHKSAKNTRYIKTPATLATDTQMLVYAHHAIESGGGIGSDEHIILRHNVFVRQPLKVIRTETQVPKMDVMKFWDTEVVPVAKRMVQLKKKGLTENDWRKFSGPADENSACNAYGGCPFLSICSGHRSPSDLRNLLDGVQSGSINQPKQGTATVSIFDKLVVGGTPTVTAAPAPQATPAAPGSAMSSVATVGVPPPAGAPPWSQPNCNSCKGVGFNLKTGGACFVCTSMSRSKNGPVPEQFIINVVEGIALWRSQDGKQKGDVRLEIVSAPVKTQVREALAPADAASLAAVDIPPVPPAGVPITESPRADVPTEPVKRPRGRPRKIALVQGIPAPTPGEIAQGVMDQVIGDAQAARTRDESELLDGHGYVTQATPEEIAANIGAPVPGERPAPRTGPTLLVGVFAIGKTASEDLSYIIATELAPDFEKAGGKKWWAAPVYERRDALVQAAQKIAERLSGRTITVSKQDSIAMALAHAMMPFAAANFYGVE
jgi:hypothetical protein